MGYPVAERASEEHQRAERQEISIHYPLKSGHAEPEVSRHRRQCDEDDAPLEEYSSRPEDRRNQHPIFVSCHCE